MTLIWAVLTLIWKRILQKKKKIHPPTPTPKNVVEDNQTIIFLGPIREVADSRLRHFHTGYGIFHCDLMKHYTVILHSITMEPRYPIRKCLTYWSLQPPYYVSFSLSLHLLTKVFNVNMQNRSHVHTIWNNSLSSLFWWQNHHIWWPDLVFIYKRYEKLTWPVNHQQPLCPYKMDI